MDAARSAQPRSGQCDDRGAAARPRPMDVAGVVDRVRRQSGGDDGVFDFRVSDLLSRHRHLGPQHHRGVGRRHRQLRLVDRHRQCRHPDFVHAAVDAAEVARLDQPFRRGDDAVRGEHRRHFSDHPSRAADVFLLAHALSQYDACVAAMAQRADLGFLGDPELFLVLDPVLVCRPHSRPRHPARPRPIESGERRSTARSHSAGAARRGTGTPTRDCISRSPASACRWSSRCTASSAWTSPQA